MAIAPLSNETELIKKISEGDKRAFKTLFEGHYKSLGAYVYKLTESLEVTEEIVQDVFIKIWLKREDLVNINSFSNYLFILSRNQTLNYLRKQASYNVRFQSLENDLETNIKADDENDSYEDFRLLIDQAIEGLPQQQKKIFYLSRHERLKYEEIAERLGISAETVKKHMYVATKAIKEYVKNHLDDIIITILLSQLSLYIV